MIDDLRGFADDCIGALRQAHTIIVAHIERREIDFNTLENYFSEMQSLLERAELQGSLIQTLLDCEIDDLLPPEDSSDTET